MADAHPLPHVVILGGGFGGLRLAQRLRRDRVRITLLDRRNHHLFQPLLYQVATAALNPSDIASPIRRILRHQRNVEVLLAEATAIDVAGRCVRLEGGTIGYDRLVLATGATHSYFGRDEWEEFAPGLKTIDDALELRRRVLYAFEAAEKANDPATRAAWLTFIVVGGGPTGVEMAGALSEIARQTLAHDFRRIDPTQARVILLEGSSRVLPPYVPELSASAQRQLERLGVEVRVGARVTNIDAEGVSIGDERIGSRTVVWAAGVAASPLARSLEVPLDRAGRVLVEPDLSVPGHPEIFVIGDLAAVVQDGQPVPGVAPAALQMADQTAVNLRRSLAGKPTTPFHYHDKGSMATIGRASAVADFGRVKLSGLLAWLAWLFVHILFLIGFRNRFIVLFQWAWSYFTYDRGARLITGPPVETRPTESNTPSAAHTT
ncbi:MAG: NAD(P)/FAD-dependent oxidoreductase [Isosphaeraceae bacterium]